MRLDRWLGPCIALLALAWLWLAFTYIPAARVTGEPGPRAFPVVLGATLLALGIVISTAAWWRETRKTPAIAVKILSNREARIVGGTFALLILYAFVMEQLGFLIATPLAMLLAMGGLLGIREWRFMLVFASGSTAICWLFFVKLLETPLPRGLWLM
jgi:putative tricarboxylic transport membrane protein